jgi:hypothetical protein
MSEEYKWKMQPGLHGVHRYYELRGTYGNHGYLFKDGRNRGGRWRVLRWFGQTEPLAVFKSNVTFEEASSAAKLILLSLQERT